jgi:hypothetical protein
MSDLRHPFVLLSALCLASLCAATCVDAQSGVGLGLGHSNRFGKTFVRGDLAIAIDETWSIVPNLEYIRANGVRRYVSSVDVHYKLPWCFVQRRLCGYLGTGLGIITEDPVGTDHSSTHDGQVNFLGGVLFDGPVVPFFEIRSDARKVNYLLGARLTF